MADRKLSRAQAGLALASALVVLLASGVAITRLSDRDDDTTAATGPDVTTPTTDAPTGPGPSLTGPATDPGGAAGQGSVTPAPGPELAAPTPAAGTRRVQRSARAGVGDSGAMAVPVDSPGAVSGTSGSAGSDTSGPSGGPGPAGSGETPPDGPPGAPPGDGHGPPPGDGSESPPAPSQEPSEPEALLTASVSVGEGSRGGVVGVGIVDTVPEVDVTVGTTQVIGDHPPAEGTGVMLGGRFLQPAPTLPSLSG